MIFHHENPVNCSLLIGKVFASNRSSNRIEIIEINIFIWKKEMKSYFVMNFFHTLVVY